MSADGWFFTFGYGHTMANGTPLRDRYLVVREPDYDVAREIMVSMRGPLWAFQYPLAELEQQVQAYNLREISPEDLAEGDAS